MAIFIRLPAHAALFTVSSSLQLGFQDIVAINFTRAFELFTELANVGNPAGQHVRMYMYTCVFIFVSSQEYVYYGIVCTTIQGTYVISKLHCFCVYTLIEISLLCHTYIL